MSILEKDRAQHPAYFGVAEFDYSRFDVYNPAIQTLFARNKQYRALTRRVNIDHVARDTTTGWREAEYDDQTIYGILVEQGGSMPAFGVGVVMRQDAILFTLDGVESSDQIQDNTKYFEVVQIEEHTDPKVSGSFSHRVCHLHRLELYRLGDS